MPPPMNSRAASLSFMRCSTAAGAVSFPNGLQVEQHRLGRGASDVLTRGAVGADHAVARDHQGQRVVAAGGAACADSARGADGGGRLGVALPAVVPDVAKVL